MRITLGPLEITTDGPPEIIVHHRVHLDPVLLLVVTEDRSRAAIVFDPPQEIPSGGS